MTRTDLREWVLSTARMLLVAIITSAVIIAGLSLANGPAATRRDAVAKELLKYQTQTYNATLATVCVLSLPTDPIKGRNPVDVRLCFTQYGLRPPALTNP
jgi:hypothetical protein